MKCSSCGTQNPKRSKHCRECGEELKVAAPQPAPAPPQPAVVIIQDDKRRRGVPGLIWILVGMILVVLLCGLLVWLDFVDVPAAIRVRLPDPIGEIVDAVDNDRPPGAPVVNLPGVVDPPGNQGRPQDPPQIQPGPGSDACDENLSMKFLAFKNISEYYTGYEYIEFEWNAPLEHDQYFVTITSGSDMNQMTDSGICDASADRYFLCQGNGPFKWLPFTVEFSFSPVGEDCRLGGMSTTIDCKSGEAWYPNWSYGEPMGCCTVGCWCDDGSGNMGCWQDCAPQCGD